jgi:hypothetical protein
MGSPDLVYKGATTFEMGAAACPSGFESIRGHDPGTGKKKIMIPEDWLIC